MTKKSILFIACIVASIFVKAQNKASNDSLVGFNYKEFKHHLANFKGTQKQKEQYIAGVRKRFINKKYGIGAANTRKNGLASSQAYYDCTNIGFEAGDTSTWNITGAYSLTTGAGVDPFGGYPVVYPGGGSYSMQLNNDLTTNSTFNTVATRGIAVTSANAYVNIHYAIDILDYPHDSAAAPKFFIKFFDATGTEIPCPQLECTYFQNGSGTSGGAGSGVSVGMPNAQNTACPGNCGTNIGAQTFAVTYQPWQTITADLTPYIGQNVTCQITCDWCIYQYDFAYCYIDADCSSSSGGSSSTITQSNPLCAGGSTILQGPPGMTSYNWTGPVSGTNQNLITSTPGNYTLTTTVSGMGSCFSAIPTLYYTLTQTTTASPSVTIVASPDTVCVGSTTTLTASGANSYTWSTGAISNTIAVAPTSVATYTAIGTDNTTGCAGSVMQVINMYGAINITSVNNPLCSGSTATLTASGANTYTWSSNAGSVTTNTVAVSPSVNATYTVTGKDTIHGCTNTATEIVYVSSNLVLNNPHDSICIGASVTLTASGATSYTWSTGSTSASIAVTPSVTISYTVTGANSCINTGTTTIKVLPLPTLTVTTSPVCEGVTATLTASGASTYLWNTGSTTASIMVTPTVTSIYTITGTATNGCKNTATGMVIVPLNPAPIICEVTTDSASNFDYNIVYWNKTGYNNVDSFLLYRYDAISATYLHIGSVSNDSLSAFKDTAFSVGGPNGGNPQYSSWKYKMAIRDTCGKISVLSPYHQSMFVQETGANFSWNAYYIDTVGTGVTNPVTGYAFLRDDNSTGSWHVLANVSNTSTSATDPNYSSYPNGNWRIDAIGFNCTPTYRLAGNNSINSIYSKSHSNVVKPTITSINQLSNSSSQINIYPNPNNGSFVIETNSAIKQTMQLYDVNGKMVMSQIINGNTNIDAGSLSEGVYNLSIISNGGVINKRLVIVR